VWILFEALHKSASMSSRNGWDRKKSSGPAELACGWRGNVTGTLAGGVGGALLPRPVPQTGPEDCHGWAVEIG
jgi:hypothetical protein